MNKRGIGVVAAMVIALGVLVLGIAALGTGDIALGPRSQGITCSDVNNDRVLDIADVIMIGEIVQNNVRLNGDCDGDKDTDFDDATALAEYLFTTGTQEKIQKDIETKLSPAIALGPAGALPACTPSLLPQYGDGTSTGFLRGDANEDGALDVADAVVSLWALFVPGTDPLLCTMLGDTNGVNGFDVSDTIYTLAYIFIPGSPAPAAPFPSLGFDVFDYTWDGTYGGTGIDAALSVIQTEDQGFAFVGATTSFTSGFWNIYLVKLDPEGNEVWVQLPGDSTLEGTGTDIIQTSDGGFAIAGYECPLGLCNSVRELLVIKTDSEGITDWTYRAPGIGFEDARAIKQTSDGGYIVVGQTFSFGSSGQAYLVKLDSLGTEEWSQTFGGSDTEGFYSVRQTEDGGYIAVGLTQSFGSVDQSAYAVKTDNLGNEEWSQTYSINEIAGFNDVRETMDGGFVFAGLNNGMIMPGVPSIQQKYVVKTDNLGNEEWSGLYGMIPSGSARGIVQTTDNGYVLTGKSSFYAQLIKIDQFGNEEWERLFVDGFDEAGFEDVEITEDNGLIVAGYAEDPLGSVNAYIVKTNAEGLVI